MHPTIPLHQGPPELPVGLRQFLADPPFELNAFAMLRFPEERPDGPADPVAAAVSVAREVCKFQAWSFISHPTEPRTTISGLMSLPFVASICGVAFFEDRRGRGMNYSLTIEVGCMLMAGRRFGLLKNTTI
jgi:hypothetical protein